MKKMKFNGNAKNILTIIVLIIVAVLLLYGWFGTNIKVNDEVLKISGLSGMSISFEDIKSTNLLDNLPVITARTFGYAVGTKKLGNFKTEEYGIVKLFLQNNTNPFVFIEKKDGEIVMFNMKSSGETIDIYRQLADKLSNSRL